jgi:DNA-binding transcriptional ArsR family regulator
MYMNSKDASMEKELVQLKERVEEMSLELRHITSLLQTSQASYTNRSELFDLLKEEARDKAETRLDSGMAKRCDMRKECRQRFMGILDDNLELLNRSRITEGDVLKQADQLDGLKAHAIPGRCDGCFNEVSSIFQQQTALMRSLRLYRTREEVRDSIDVLPEIEVVRDLLEPLSNVQRMIILKSLAKSPCSFSELSSLTNLRGGNLLFHIQRLTASGMICQRSGHGDYALADRGMRALEMVNDLYQRTATSSEAVNGESA